MIARELGLGITSISNIHSRGRARSALGYQILIALVKRSGKYDLRFVERTDELRASSTGSSATARRSASRSST
jgi:hypothetical protein